MEILKQSTSVLCLSYFSLLPVIHSSFSPWCPYCAAGSVIYSTSRGCFNTSYGFHSLSAEVHSLFFIFKLKDFRSNRMNGPADSSVLLPPRQKAFSCYNKIFIMLVLQTTIKQCKAAIV